MFKQFIVVFVIAMMVGSTIQQSASLDLGANGSEDASGGVTGSGDGSLGPITINGQGGLNGSESTSGNGDISGSI